MKKQKSTPVKFSSPIRYQGSLILLILFLILWFPLGVLMLLKNGYLIQRTSNLSLNYHGNWGWLYFWGIIFFPVAFVLLALGGTDVVQKRKTL